VSYALIAFFYLQTLDVLTTLTFLMVGVKEANPLFRIVFSFTGSPLVGLLAIKSLSGLLVWYCWRRQRRNLLNRINLFYAALVAWNLFALLVGTAVIEWPLLTAI